MLNFGNKEFRNLEEQVGKNQEDIKQLQSGIKIERWLAQLSDLSDYMSQENVGKYYLVYISERLQDELYVITLRKNGGLIAINLGKYPAKGDQGPIGPTGANGATGPQGERGPRGFKGDDGAMGLTGAGVNTLTEVKIAGDASVSYSDGIARIQNAARASFAGTDDTHPFIADVELPIKGNNPVSITANDDSIEVSFDTTGAQDGQVLRYSDGAIEWYTIPQGIPVIDGDDEGYNNNFNNLGTLDPGLYIIKDFSTNMPALASGATVLLEVEKRSTDIYFTVSFGEYISTRIYLAGAVWTVWDNYKLTSTTSTMTVLDTGWSALSGAYPFSWQQTVAFDNTLNTYTEIELINDNAVDFAQYGFAIGAVDFSLHTATVYAVNKPADSKTLTVRLK